MHSVLLGVVGFGLFGFLAAYLVDCARVSRKK